MKKVMLLASALAVLAALPAKAQTPYPDYYRQYLMELGASLRGPDYDTMYKSIIHAAAAGDADAVKFFAEKNNYTLDEYVKAFDAASNQPTRDRVYAKAVNQMVRDATEYIPGTLGGPFGPGPGEYKYTVDYKKYYTPDSTEYSKQNVILYASEATFLHSDTVKQVARLFKPILNDFLVKHSKYGADALKMITPSYLLAYEGDDAAPAAKTDKVFALQPDKAAVKHTAEVKANLQKQLEPLFPKA